MSYRGLKFLLLACSGVGALIAATADANAGGFAIREQSAYGQGSSFSGVAAGGSLSSMFWNPATMTQMPGLQSETVLSGILPYSANTVGAPSTSAALGGTGNTGLAAVVPSSYYSWQVRPDLWLGLSITAPFGLAMTFPDAWAGRGYGEESSLKTYNFTPSIAYAINNWISIGAGIQVQYAKADVGFGLPTGLTHQALVSGTGWGYGFTAGVTLTPTPTTTIGLGWRSGINQKISGTLALPSPALNPAFGPPFSTPGSVNTTLNLPDIVSLGLRQRLTPQWMAMATFEWSHWSRIGTSNVLQSNGSPALVVLNPVTFPFQFHDGWFGSLGAEYQWNPQLALRAGVAYEKSPISDQVRIPVLPDNDRLWLSAGATYQLTKKMSFDFAYSHIFVKSTPISVSAVSGNPWFTAYGGLLLTYNGTVSSHVDIISVALKYRWDDPPAPVKPGYFKAK